MNLDGVSKAIVSLDKGTAVVTYDPNRIGLNQMTEATTNAGFPSTVDVSEGSD